MPYGFPKITNRECRNQILDAIALELDKRHEFAGVGNCFFGYEFDFNLNITLVTRGERKLEIAKTGKVDQPAEVLCTYTFNDGISKSWACGLPYGHDGEHSEKVIAISVDPPVITQIKLSGQTQKGKQSKDARAKAAQDKIEAHKKEHSVNA